MTGSRTNTRNSVTVLEARIIKQIEYYFSDFNLLSDKFLKEKIQEDDGWVTIDTMLKFNRLKEITDNAQTICEALKKSSSGLMEVSEQGDKIRRSLSKPLTSNTKKKRKEIIDRTVFAKPFPLDVKLDDLLEFFEGYGQLDSVIMNKHFEKKTFKGSVFVTFSNKEDATKFVSEEETKFKEQALEVKCFQIDYFTHKAAQRVSQRMTKNAVLYLKGLNSKTSREQVKTFFSDVLQSEVAWVDFDKGATEGYIRLREPDSAGSTLEKAKSAVDGKVVIQGSEIEIRVVEGNEELQYWQKMFTDIEYKKKNGGRGRREGERNQIDERSNRGRQQGKREQIKKKNSEGGDSDREEQVTEKSSAKDIKSEKDITTSQGKMKQNEKDASNDGEDQDKEEPPVKIIKSDKIITRSQAKRKQNGMDVSNGGEEQDAEEPPAKVIKSKKVITRSQAKRKQNEKDATNDGEEQDTDEPPEDPLARPGSVM
ncbi:hypothetical protein BsWGS_00876 [Bradybaena similaris]